MKSNTTTLSLASNSASTSPSATATVSMDTLLAATSQIVSAYLVNRPSEQVNLTALTADVFGTLRTLAEQEVSVSVSSPAARSGRTPVVAIEDSIKGDYLVCLEDGKRVKMLKRYLKTSYNMTPEEYRARWSLPATYPMVAPNYAQVRSQLAKQIGLGRRGLPNVAKRMAAASAAANLR